MLAALLVLCVLPGIARASTILVENNHDSGPGSLRDAVASATSGSTITVPAFTITLASPITVTQASPGVTINGAGAGSTTISGNNTTRMFSMIDTTEMTLSALTLTAGSGLGGAIHASNSSRLTIVSSTLSGNSANGTFGGAVQMFNNGTLTITNSTLSGNYANGNFGGAIQMYNDGTLTITNSTLSGNHADSGGAIQMFNDGALTITNSTLSDNHADSGGVGGGAIHLYPGAHGRILSTTINANTASSGKGGGIRTDSTTTGQVHFKNSIVSGNTAKTDANCSFASLGLVSQGYNDENGSSCPFSAAGDLNADPMLGPLQNNGGLTFTQAPGGASPVIDAGTNSDCPATDQRDAPRPDNRETLCDIGAYETQDISSPVPGAAFGPTPTAAAPPAPTCTGTVGAKISSSSAFGRGMRRRARGPFVLTIVVSCDQNTSVMLSGTVSATSKKKRKKVRGASAAGAAKKPKVQTFSLTSRTAIVQARTSTKLTLAISKGTLTKLSRLARLHATLGANLSVTATNSHGMRITRLAAQTLKLSKKKR